VEAANGCFFACLRLAQVWYVRLPAKRLPVTVVTTIRTTNLPLGSPRRSIGALMREPLIVLTRRPFTNTLAETTFSPCTLRRWMTKWRPLTQRFAEGSPTAAGATFTTGGGGVTGGGVVGGVVITGFAVGVTAFESAVAAPPALDALTRQLRLWPASAAVAEYVAVVAPSIGWPSRSHWKLKLGW
jgi:hypothetical protein